MSMSQLTIPEAIDLAKRAQQAKDLRRAQTIYHQVLSVSPNHPDALHLLGLVEFQSGRLEPAKELIKKAIWIHPSAAHFHVNLGHVLTQMNRMEEAVEAYERAIVLHPDFPQAREGLVGVLAWLGQERHGQADWEGSAEAYERALAMRPNRVELLNNLGAALLEKGDAAAAAEALRRAVFLRADFADGWNNLGDALRDLHQLDEASRVYQKASQLRPDWAIPKYNLGVVKMLMGDLRSGWPLMEYRWAESELARFRAAYTKPEWRGEPLNGKRIILHAEQGFGDAIQFIRYVPQVIEDGGRVVVACARELVSLFQHSIPAVERWLAPGDAMPEYDVHCSLISLPCLFDTTESAIPRQIPYLRPSAETSGHWRERLESSDERMKIGLAWAGRSTHRRDRFRSIWLDLLAPLGEEADVRWFNLQVGRNRAEDLKFEISDFTSDLTDFEQTAGLIDQLDLVITVDTSVAHLAGAMGKPVWVLIPFAPDWRWMLERKDSPWYPTMRLFRQPEPGDWRTPIDRIVHELRDFTRSKKP